MKMPYSSSPQSEAQTSGNSSGKKVSEAISKSILALRTPGIQHRSQGYQGLPASAFALHGRQRVCTITVLETKLQNSPGRSKIN
jgi:hypothetical protein